MNYYLKIAVSLFFFLIVGKILASGSKELKLSLTQVSSESLNLAVINKSHGKLTINQRFTLVKHAESFNGVSFLFVKKNEQCYLPYLSSYQRSPWRESDFVELMPSQQVGINIEIKKLIDIYYLSAGEYKAKAFYKNIGDKKNKGRSVELSSDWLNIVLTEKESQLPPVNKSKYLKKEIENMQELGQLPEIEGFSLCTSVFGL